MVLNVLQVPLRQKGEIPGVYYSATSKESIPISILDSDFYLALKSGARIFNISVGGKKQNVLFKSVQYHPVTDEVLHVDLYGVNMDQVVAVKVQLRLEGSAAGVLNEGGVLVQSLNEIEIECLPSDIPENIEVDISNLILGDTLKVGEINLEEKFSVNADSEQVVGSDTLAIKEEDAQPDLEEGQPQG